MKVNSRFLLLIVVLMLNAKINAISAGQLRKQNELLRFRIMVSNQISILEMHEIRISKKRNLTDIEKRSLADIRFYLNQLSVLEKSLKY